MLFVHRSNRLEKLADSLAELVRCPLDDPLAAERIVVQSRGMERWLALRLTDRFGVWANARFPFPRNAIEELYAGVLGDRLPAQSPYTPEQLVWTLRALVPQLLPLPELEPLRGYVSDDDGGL